MDGEAELQAIQELVERGPEAYKDFLKAKGVLDVLSSDEKDLLQSPGFDFKALAALKLPPGKGDEAFRELEELSSKGVLAETSDIYFSPPMDVTVTISQLLLQMIGSAQSSVKLAMYTFSDATIFKALYNKAASVPVHILLDEAQLQYFTNMLVNNKSDFPTQPDKMSIGVITGLTSGKYTGIAHEKFMTVDNKKAFTGSYNFTWSAANINRELAIFTASDGTAGPIIPRLSKQWAIMAQTKKAYVWPNVVTVS